MKFRSIDLRVLEQRCRALADLGLLERAGGEWKLTPAGNRALSTLLATAWLERTKPPPKPRPTPTSGSSNVVPFR